MFIIHLTQLHPGPLSESNQMATSIEKLDWSDVDVWIERFEALSTVQIAKAKLTEPSDKEDFKKALLTTSLGNDAYSTLRNHLLPKKMAEVTCDEAIKALRTA